MDRSNRREFLQASGGLALASALAGCSRSSATPQAQPGTGFAPEAGAHLRVLRWSRFVQGDMDTYLANTKRFTEQTGIEVHVDSEGWEDVRPKAAVAANAGGGPDIILSTNDDANLYADKLLDVTDLCEYLAHKYGGFYPSCEAYLRPDGKHWIGVPLGATGALMVYRDSHVKAAGFETFPRDTGGFLKMFKALKEKGTPGGMALGNATGDSGWTHWLMWAFGGSIVDKESRVVINSPETLRALEYAAELYPSFVPGTQSWLDPNNNKAFLDGQISATNNGISIYYTAKNSPDPKLKQLAADIYHAPFPIGPVGVPTEYHLFFNQMIMSYTKYPNAAKEFLRFMMEREQYDPWLVAAGGYVSQPLRAYESCQVWSSDAKHLPYRDSVKNLRPAGYAGKLGYASAGALADFIVANMVGEAASGQRTPKEAAERAQIRAERYYKA
jgi:multiple sugar transport system substrate-binding protein